MEKHFHLLKENLGKSIGNGQTIRLWKDSWISLDRVLKPMGPIKEEALDLTVADLLTSELKWNKQRIEELLPNLSMQILCIKPSSTGAEDSFIWHQTSSGLYTTKSGYFAASMSLNQTSLARAEGEFSWIRDVWAGKFSPKMKTFLWSILQKAISLGSNLQRRGVTSATGCVRCQEAETDYIVSLPVSMHRMYGNSYPSTEQFT